VEGRRIRDRTVSGISPVHVRTATVSCHDTDTGRTHCASDGAGNGRWVSPSAVRESIADARPERILHDTSGDHN
jgi:hypothetical protein